MKAGLLIHKHDDVDDYFSGKRFRFAVVDLDKGKNYPLNFVCLLPMQPNPSGKGTNVFEGIFKDTSHEITKILLLEALGVETDFEIKREIERSLGCLIPSPSTRQIALVVDKHFKLSPKKVLSKNSVMNA